MTTINETISESLRSAGLSGYERQARPVIDALVERETRIFTGIVEAASAQGLDRRQTTSLLRDLGLTEPSLAASIEDGDLAARVARLEQFARDNGFEDDSEF